MAETFADIQFPYSRAGQLTGSVNNIRIRRWEYQHEACIIDVWRAVGNDLRLRSNAPVAVRIKGAASSPMSFVGYVHDVREVVQQNTQGQRLHRVLCFGPTYRMKESRQRTWTDVTISDVARQICREYQLAADVEDHGTRYQSLHQSGETDWEFLCRIARQHGYVMYPEGTTVHFHSRSRDETLKHRQAHRFQYSDARLGRTQIWTYQATFGESLTGREGAQAVQVVSNVDIRTGQIFSVADDGSSVPVARAQSSSPQFTRFATEITAVSAEDAGVRAAGAQERTRWAYSMNAEVDGKADTVPTSVLYLEGLTNGYDGAWTVVGVEHVFDKKYSHHMKAELGTNSLGRSLIEPDASRPANVAMVPVQPRLLTPGGPLASLISGGPVRDYIWVGSAAEARRKPEAVLAVRR